MLAAMELDTADPTSEPSMLLPDIEPWLDPVDKDLQLKVVMGAYDM